MIAYDGLPIPKDITLDKETQQQVHIYGSALFCKEGRTLKLFRHDLNGLKIADKLPAIERSCPCQYEGCLET